MTLANSYPVEEIYEKENSTLIAYDLLVHTCNLYFPIIVEERKYSLECLQ